ncbi:hypothetical protein BDV95DRAFT_581452 [Massariosphaeria phaeospora]|uniref:BTB domain-containing protein n=1 Tax=Massariosphaeria phaeospora TaxID=100035 RepID=A0A7C8I494_9PLEO|nr:hypothetical protein BDV95DRAFT_581452 [Massariosphaeria phaeospora]
MTSLPHADLIDIGTKAMTVRVGIKPHFKDFTVHENLIRNSSAFFKEALSHENDTDQPRIVQLPDCLNGMGGQFHIYQQWLYTGRLYTGKSASEDNRRQEWTRLYGCYLLGDSIQDTNFMDVCMDAMVKWADDCGKITQLETRLDAVEIYKKTPETSPLRLLFVDLIVEVHDYDFWKAEKDHDFSYAFMRDMVIALAYKYQSKTRKSRSLPPYKNSLGQSCHYHCRGDAPCYKSNG